MNSRVNGISFIFLTGFIAYTVNTYSINAWDQIKCFILDCRHCPFDPGVVFSPYRWQLMFSNDLSKNTTFLGLQYCFCLCAKQLMGLCVDKVVLHVILLWFSRDDKTTQQYDDSRIIAWRVSLIFQFTSLIPFPGFLMGPSGSLAIPPEMFCLLSCTMISKRTRRQVTLFTYCYCYC